MKTKKAETVVLNTPAASVIAHKLVTHFRKERDSLRQRWVQMMTGAGLLSGLTKKEIESESSTIYDTCIGCLETGKFDAAEAYAKRMAERAVLQGMATDQILGGLLTLRDVYGRSLKELYQNNDELWAALDIYEPVAKRILSIVAMAFIQEREKVVRQQQEAIRELSTPVLQVRAGLLILPLIGVLDSVRARQLTENLLKAIRANRAQVVVIDVTGVPAVDSKVANHLLQTVEASRLMGAKVLITGLSPEIAQAVVTIGVDLGRVMSLSDLQRGIEEADRLLGYRLTDGSRDKVAEQV